MVITTSNIYTESRTVLKNLIAANVTDPRTNQVNSRRRWIYREEVDTTSLTFEGYPILIIRTPDFEDELQDLQESLSDGQFTIQLGVFSEYNDANARTDSISNDIYALFRNKTHQATLNAANMYEVKVTSSPQNEETKDGKLLSGRVFTIQFNSTLEDHS